MKTDNENIYEAENLIIKLRIIETAEKNLDEARNYGGDTDTFSFATKATELELTYLKNDVLDAIEEILKSQTKKILDRLEGI